MKGDYFNNKYKVDSARLSDWDYSWAGYYFFTICTKNRQNFFGEIRKGIMGLNELGCVAWKYWHELSKHYFECVLDEFIVMPNHVHGVIQIIELCRDGACPVSTKYDQHSLSNMLGSFKSACSKTIHENYDIYFQWQPRFHDHVVRIGQQYLETIRHYIKNNPAKWYRDRNNII